MTTPALPEPTPETGVTRDDVLRARLAFRKAAPPTWRDLLDAPEVEE